MAYHHQHSEFSPFVFWGVSEQCVIRLEKRPKIFKFFIQTSAKKCPILIKSFIWTGPQHHITIIIHTEAKGGTATNLRWQYIECKHLFTNNQLFVYKTQLFIYNFVDPFYSKEGYQSGFSSIVIFFYVLLRILLSIFHVKLEQIMREFCLPPVTEDFAISHWKILPDIVFHMLWKYVHIVQHLWNMRLFLGYMSNCKCILVCFRFT